MRLLYICHHRKHKTFRSGGFAGQMVRRGHDVTLICISESRRFGIREYTEEGIHYAEMPDLLPGRMRSGWDPWGVWNRCGFLRDKEYDLIHAFETRPATIHPVLQLLRRQPTPLVIDWVDWWGRGGLIKEQRPGWYQLLFGWLETFYEEHFRTLADGTTVISRGLGERAKSLGVPDETIYWVPSGSDVSNIEVVSPALHRAKFGLSQNAYVLGFSALDVMIGVDLVLDALKLAILKYPETLLIMTGKESPALHKMVAERNLAQHVRRFGVLPYDDYLQLLSCVDVFLLPFIDTVANRGRWPGRIRDYMAVARPVISNSVGDMKSLLSEEDIGLLADEKPQDMADKIQYLRENANLRARLGRNARQLAEHRFSLTEMTDRLEACYRESVTRWQKKTKSEGKTS